MKIKKRTMNTLKKLDVKSIMIEVPVLPLDYGYKEATKEYHRKKRIEELQASNDTIQW